MPAKGWRADIVKRFWARVGPPDENGCRRWLGGTFGGRYGAFCFNGQNRGTHVIAWRLTYHGPVVPGSVFRHSCDRGLCCEPSHVYPGTYADNSLDMVRRGRSLSGERNPAAKLTASDVTAICASSESNGAVAKDYGVMIARIRNRLAWKHLDIQS